MVDRRALIAAVAAGAAVFAATAMLYQHGGDVVVDFENAYEGGFISGFHGRERADGDYFRWTREVSYLDFRQLPETGELSVAARLRVRRPPGEPLPNLAFTANGATVHATRGLPGTVSYHFTVPATDPHVRIGIRSDTFDPSGKRPLGVQVLGVILHVPEGETPSWWGASIWMGAAAMLLFAGAFVSWESVAPATGAALVASAAFIFLLAQHSLRFTAYPRQVALLTAAALGVAWLARRLQRFPRPSVTGAIAAVFLVEIAIATYPLAVSSDADFQANRMQHFLDGDWHPTSVTQHEDPFRIPYPVALYVLTTPLVKLGLDSVPALALVTALSDVLVSIALIFVAGRFLDDVRGGVLAAILYQLVPMNASSFSAGNFTNLFAVSMLTLAFATMIRHPIVSGLFTFLALTAHFGMLLEGVVLCPVWLAVLWLGPTPVKDERKRLTVAWAVSFALAGIYYLGYADLVTSQWGRALSSTGSETAGGFQSTLSQLGAVFLVVSVAGAASLVRRPLSPAVRATLLGWLGVTVFFLIVEMVSPIEIRYALQALPLLGLFAGTYLASTFDRGRVGTIAGTAAMLYMVAIGVRTLHDVLLVRYH